MGGVFISKIEFLNNVQLGKNSWWRYLITVILTGSVGVAVVIMVGIVLMFIYAIMMVQNGNMNVIGTQISQILLDPIVLIFLTLVMYVFSFLTFYICVRFIHKRKLLSFINTDFKIDWMKIFKGAILWFAILGIFTLISFISDPEYLKFTFNPSIFGIFLLITLIGIPIQASFEEIFFRGYLMQGFGLLSKKPIIPLLITSVLFAILHGANGINSLTNIFIVLQIFVIGLMLGIIALGENRIETAMGVHISNNLYAFLIVSSSDEVVRGVPSIFTAPPSTPVDLYTGLLTTIVAAIIVLLIVFRGKRDKLRVILTWNDLK